MGFRTPYFSVTHVEIIDETLTVGSRMFNKLHTMILDNDIEAILEDIKIPEMTEWQMIQKKQMEWMGIKTNEVGKFKENDKNIIRNKLYTDVARMLSEKPKDLSYTGEAEYINSILIHAMELCHKFDMIMVGG